MGRGGSITQEGWASTVRYLKNYRWGTNMLRFEKKKKRRRRRKAILCRIQATQEAEKQEREK